MFRTNRNCMYLYFLFPFAFCNSKQFNRETKINGRKTFLEEKKNTRKAEKSQSTPCYVSTDAIDVVILMLSFFHATQYSKNQIKNCNRLVNGSFDFKLF